MVRLPDSSTLRRNIPQATSAIQNVPVAMDFQAIQGLGEQIGRAGSRLYQQSQREELIKQQEQQELLRQQEKQDNEIKKFQMAQKSSEITIESNRLLASLNDEPDFTKYQNILDVGFKTLKERVLKDAPNDPIVKGYLELKLNEEHARGQLKTHKLQKTKQADSIKASVFSFGEDYKNLFQTADTEQQSQLNSNLYSMFYSARDAGVINAEEAEIGINKTRQDAERNRLKSLTPEQIITETGGYNSESEKYLRRLALESGGYNLQNAQSSAGGYFQWTDATAKQYGVTKGNLKSEIAGLKKFDADNVKEFKSVVGREPEQWETYLLHQQGGKGGSAIIANPDKNIVDVLTPFYNNKETLREAIVNNGGSVDMTAGEFSKIWRDKESQADISKIPNDVAQTIETSFGGVNSTYPTLPSSELFKAREKAIKERRKKEIETKTTELTSALTSQTPNLKQQEMTLNSYDIDPEIKEKVSFELYKIDSELKRDPIGYLENKAMQTGNDFDLESAVDVQRQRGIPESRASVLSKNDSEMVTQNLLAVKSVPEMQQWLNGVKQKVGDKYLPQAFRQLVKDGLPKEYKYVLALDPYKDADEMRVMFNGLTADKQEFNDAFKAKLLTINEKKTDFEKNLNTSFENIIDQENKKGTNNTQSLNDSLKLMAQSHFIQYGDSEKAIEFAKNSYMKNYYNNNGEFYTVDGTPLAIPLNATSDYNFVVNSLEAYKDNNVNDIFSIEGRFKEIEQEQKETIMDNAYFALNPQEDGVFLYDETGLLILNKDKKPIELKFSELTAKQEQNKKSIAMTIAKEQAERQARIAKQEANKPIELLGD